MTPTQNHPGRAAPRLLALCGLLFSLTPLASSQTVPPPANAPTGNEAAIVLSPFTVQTERDTGYQATSTLAGTRLNTPIRDLASGISVLTRDLITDLGATNINELLIYSVGAEAAGSQGNFGGAVADDTGQSVRNSPQSSTRKIGRASCRERE